MRGLCADSARQFWTVRQSAAACPIFRHTIKAGTVSACCGVVWGQIWTKFWHFFFGVFVVARVPHDALNVPRVLVCTGAQPFGSWKTQKGQKRTQNGPKKNSKRAEKEWKFDFLKIDFWGPPCPQWQNKMFDGTDFANSSPLMRYERASTCFFWGPPPQLEYSVTKLVTLSH